MMKAKGNRVANQDLEESLLPSDPQGKQAPELKVNVAPAVVGETEREDGNEHSKSKQGGLVGAITRSCRGDNLLLALYTLGLLFTSVGNSVFFKKMTNAMPNYSFFLNQLTSTVYIPIFFSLIWYADFSGKLSEEEKKFPKSRFLALGALDALAGICMLFGGVHTAGTLQVVFQQLTIPVTLIASGLLLRAKYHLWQILGALVILGGVVVVQLPVILGWDSSGDAFAGNSTTFNIIFSLSAVPMALSSVFKEVAFRGVSLDVNLLQGWVAFWQVLIGFVLLPLNTLPFLEDQKLEWKDIPESLWGGCKCLFAGVNTYGEGGKACGGPDQHPCDACGAAWIPVVVYLAFNVGYNVFMLLVIKYGSATLSFLVATLRLPLSSFAFYAPFIMGDDAQEFQWTDLAGLAVLLIGLVLYRVGAHMQEQKAERELEREKKEADLLEVEAGGVGGERPKESFVCMTGVGGGIHLSPPPAENGAEAHHSWEEEEVPVFTSFARTEPSFLRVLHKKSEVGGEVRHRGGSRLLPPPEGDENREKMNRSIHLDERGEASNKSGVATRAHSGSMHGGGFPQASEREREGGADV